MGGRAREKALGVGCVAAEGDKKTEGGGEVRLGGMGVIRERD